MERRVIVLSGRVASGKSTLAQGLHDRFGATVFKTQDLLRARLGTERSDRQALQRAGTALDRRTTGRWVADALWRQLELDDGEAGALIVVDAVRRENQVEGLRKAFGPAVAHIHLIAPMEIIKSRFDGRTGREGEAHSYEVVAADPTERQVDSMKSTADVVIDTVRNTADDVLARAASRLGLYGSSSERLVDVIVGGQYGSEGKGHIVAHLAAEYDLFVRGGGPNAGHSVLLGEEKYIYHHLPSGTRTNPQAHVLLAPGAVLWLPRLLDEIAECGIEAQRLSIDPRAMIISEEDQTAEKANLVGAIASTGQGVGYATARRIRRGNDVELARDISALRPYIRDADDVLSGAYARRDRILVEGTQGSGLSLYHGPYPKVTSRDTNASGTLAEAGIPPHRVRRVIMVCRTYPIRVGGNSGPMSGEITWEAVSERSGIPLEELQTTEKTSTTGRDRRVAEFDWDLLRRSARLNSPTDIALTFADYLSIKNRNARRFEQLTDDSILFVEEVERVAQAPISLITTRFHVRSIIDRRRWW
jgi:adenylosuccinate synthase